ncbi:MAG: xylulokinase [Arenicella sp.]
MYLGIDCGTQGTKVIVLDTEQACILGEGYSPHSLITDEHGRREQEPGWWIEAFINSYHDALKSSEVDSRLIKGIGVSGQQHGLVTLNKTGQVIRPAKLWCDTETEPQNIEILHKLGGIAGSLDSLGLVITTGYTISKLLWLKQNEPESFQKIAHILLPHDYFNYWLTGELVTEYGDASGTGYFDVRSRQWSPEMLELIGCKHLVSALPTLLPAEQPVGLVKKDIANLLRLNSNVVVASGGGDNMMGAIGTGNIHEGIVTMSLGTSGAVYANSSLPLKPNPLIAPFCSSTNEWLPLICTMNVTSALNVVRELFDLTITDFNVTASQAQIGCSGITMLPFLNGERVPDLPDAKGSILGLNAHNMTTANLCRAVMEGATFGLRYGLDLLCATGIQSSEIRLIGGGSKSQLWRQMVANVMNTRIVCPDVGEAAALGAAIQAVWCDSRCHGNPVELTQLCDRYVRLDPSRTTLPEPQASAAYQSAYTQYKERLSLIHTIN